MDLPRSFAVRERDHRIHDPFTPEKLALLGEVIRLRPGMSMLDLACGSGEWLCQWSRAHGITGHGVDISTVFLTKARARAGQPAGHRRRHRCRVTVGHHRPGRRR
ncbi:SAM-dependent methyltransferase, partial [Actinoplanes philippinensis]|uniref:SAM-dependent methyltransferase n=1 Tax=Actinoplanes philippinensis TaxID=35752 RepID=UPI0033F38848